MECFEGDPGSGVLLLVEGHQCYFWLRDILVVECYFWLRDILVVECSYWQGRSQDFLKGGAQPSLARQTISPACQCVVLTSLATLSAFSLET